MSKDIIEFVWFSFLVHDIIVIPLIFIVNDFFNNYEIKRKDKNK